MIRLVAKQLVDPQRRQEIAELAEAVADEHCPRGQVEPAAVALARRITVSFGAYGEAFDGMLEHLDGRFHAYVNADRVGRGDSPRCRFTLAHELGHFYIDEHRWALAGGQAGPHPSQCEYESPILPEQEADLFAANLLMPPRRFIGAGKAAECGLGGVLALAAGFGVSITAAAIQYAACDVRACAVVKWDRGGYAWKRLSSSTFQARLRRTVQDAGDLPPDCPTRRAMGGERPPPPEGFFQAGATASAWFTRIPPGLTRRGPGKPGAAGDILFIEQAIPLGRFGVLTFLHPAERLRPL